MNTKLIDRATRIVSEIAKIPYDTAGDYLKKADNKVKVACVMAIKHLSKEESIKCLKENNGLLRKAIL